MNKDFSDFEAFLLTDEAKEIKKSQWDKTHDEYLALMAEDENQKMVELVAAERAGKMALLRVYHEWLKSDPS